MSAVASPSAAPTPSRSVLKRRHEPSSSDDDVCAKQRYFYVLAPESTDYSSDGPESIYSVQAHSTDVARDTSDTSSKDSWSVSGGSSRMFELEVVSLSESDPMFPLTVSTSSSPEDMLRIVLPDSGVEPSVGCSSRRSAEGSDDEVDGRVKSSGLFSFCRRCKSTNSDPHFMYCIRCYRLRKSFLPERPKRRRGQSKTRTSSLAKEEDPHDSGIHSQSSSGTLPLDNTPPISFDSTTTNQVCQICMMSPRDGGFCHDNIVHVYSCYRCSLKMFKQRGRCPVCNRKPRHISRVINV